VTPTFAPANKTTVSLPPRISDDWKNCAIPLVLNQFSSLVDGDRFYGFLDFLPGLYTATSKTSCLIFATNAVAKTYITNQTHSPIDENELRHVYIEALRSTNLALQSPSESVQDSTIAAVWLLSIHEVNTSRTLIMYSPHHSYMIADF
jgi:hypothetical protein